MLKKLFSIFILIIWSANASASNSLYSFYYETDTGDEIKVDVIGSFSDPRFVFYNSKNYDNTELFRQYVKSTLEKRNYRYTWQETCGNNCNIDISHEKSAPAKFIRTGGLKQHVPKLVYTSAGRQKVKTPDTYSQSPTNKLVETVANELVSRTVSSVMDMLLQDKTKQNSPFTIIESKWGDPIAMCKMGSSGCQTIDEVIFSDTDNGYGVAHPAYTVGDIFTIDINNALSTYSTSKGMTCKTVYTGTAATNDMRAQTVCYSSY